MPPDDEKPELRLVPPGGIPEPEPELVDYLSDPQQPLPVVPQGDLSLRLVFEVMLEVEGSLTETGKFEPTVEFLEQALKHHNLTLVNAERHAESVKFTEQMDELLALLAEEELTEPAVQLLERILSQEGD